MANPESRIMSRNRISRGPIAGLLTFALAVPMLAQQPEHARFDVVSIKRNLSGAASSSLRPEPNGLTGVNVNALRLVRVAYQVPDFQIVDAPGWFEAERFDLNARAASTVTLAQLQAMIQGLLADRFGLRVTRERRAVAGYELRVERAGHAGLRPSPRPCAIATQDQPRATGALPPCFQTADGEMTARGVTLEMLARELQGRVERPVVNQTALDSTYDFELRWAPATTSSAGDSDAPSMFTAVREQLGLRLVAAKPTVDVYVINAAERPARD
jgi:uncharacterized protein (TIGR03435 family)